jgi:AraC-like DNA-binding protein
MSAGADRSEEMRVWRVPALAGLELTRATYVSHSFERHAHETLAVGVIDSGGGAFWCEGATHQAPTDSVVLIAAGDVHTGGVLRTDAALRYRMFYPSLELARRFMRDAPSTPSPRFPDHTCFAPRLARRLRAVHDALQHPQAGLAEESAFLQLLETVLVRYGNWTPAAVGRPSDARLAQRLREFLHAHLEERISLEQLAGVAQRHPQYLNRVFSRSVGLPPHAYLNQIRVERARELLRRGLAPAEVAALTGFADQSHLNRVFKRQVGTTPGRYQRELVRVKNVLEDPSASR